ncbi:PREDICTED: uncharacterized protein LOC104730355 isoform X1 [Camelina sativa]|uniref:Uncharacterized protein LOC104730355 isoform X1 n=1 Tax=Camelina sativa TaxID=90675 RepID=A0ABM0UXL1_CAMSA|nr:PREDICTED: uncharacterized protein LOC104730355 isoform X1 [Camelina sativa]
MLFLCINLEDMSLVGLPSNYLIPLTYNVPITRHRTLRFCRIKKQRKRVMVRGEGFGLRFPANSPRTRTRCTSFILLQAWLDIVSKKDMLRIVVLFDSLPTELDFERTRGRQIAQETSGKVQYGGGRQPAVLRTFSQRLCIFSPSPLESRKLMQTAACS